MYPNVPTGSNSKSADEQEIGDTEYASDFNW
jgi:hypothetical protein